jgi:hypothetical protein
VIKASSGVSAKAVASVELGAPAADAGLPESYPTLRRALGEGGFTELARLIRTTYEATEQRRMREPSEPPWRDTGGEG